MRQFVGSVTGFAMAELDALPWDEFLDEVETAMHLRADIQPPVVQLVMKGGS